MLLNVIFKKSIISKFCKNFYKIFNSKKYLTRKDRINKSFSQAYLSFHSYGQYILYPWGYDKRLPPDYVDLDNVGRQAATAMKKAGGAASVYTVGNSATTLYPASGGSDDWAKALLKLKYTYTIELRDTGRYGFILPARYIIPTAKEALAAVEVVTEACKTA